MERSVSKSVSWTFSYSSRRMPVMGENVVATSQPLAAQAGLCMLLGGGNAVDAAVAAAVTLTCYTIKNPIDEIELNRRTYV